MDTVGFIGIGAQKCASSWVYRVLADHPEVFVSTPKEVDFFSNFYTRGYQWYHGHFGEHLGKKMCGEISPSYFHNVMVPERIRKYSPSAKIVLCLRDPIKRAYSNHLHMIREGFLTGEDLSFENGMVNNPTYIYQSLYATHLRRWLECFPENQLVVLIQEEIEEDPVSHASELYASLGVNPDFRSSFLFRKGNPSQEEKFKGVDKALKAVGAAGRALGLDHTVSRVRESKLVRGMRSMNYQHLSETVPPMSTGTRSDLVKFFAVEMRDFCDLLGRTPRGWEEYVS